MSIDTRVKEVQLEFSFLNDIRMKTFFEAQKKEMYTLYEVNYARDGDYGKGLRFGDFIAEIWVKQGLAAKFREENHGKYFYDSPDFGVYKAFGKGL